MSQTQTSHSQSMSNMDQQGVLIIYEIYKIYDHSRQKRKGQTVHWFFKFLPVSPPKDAEMSKHSVAEEEILSS